MTTNPEPTSLYAVVVGKRDGETLIAVRADGGIVPWMLFLEPGYFDWCDWTALCREMTDIRGVPVAEVDDKMTEAEMAEEDRMTGAHVKLTKPTPTPGPWLRDDELDAALPTLKAGDVVEVEHAGHRASGELWEKGHDGLFLWGSGVRWDDGESGFYVDALRIIERAPEPEPEPGADIPEEVVAAAMGVLYDEGDGELPTNEVLRAALAAADAKRAELAEGGQA